MTGYRVGGMTCDGCAKAVTRAIQAAAPGTRVKVDRPMGRVEIEGPVEEAVLRRAVEEAGFEFGGRA